MQIHSSVPFTAWSVMFLSVVHWCQRAPIWGRVGSFQYPIRLRAVTALLSISLKINLCTLESVLLELNNRVNFLRNGQMSCFRTGVCIFAPQIKGSILAYCFLLEKMMEKMHGECSVKFYLKRPNFNAVIFVLKKGKALALLESWGGKRERLCFVAIWHGNKGNMRCIEMKADPHLRTGQWLGICRVICWHFIVDR